MYLNIKQVGRKSPRVGTPKRILESPAIMAFEITTIFLSSNPNQLCDRINLLIQERKARNVSDIVNQEIKAIADNLIE